MILLPLPSDCSPDRLFKKKLLPGEIEERPREERTASDIVRKKSPQRERERGRMGTGAVIGVSAA